MKPKILWKIKIISEISNKLYEKNLIHTTNRDCQKTVNEYLGNLKKLGMNDEHLIKIQLFLKKQNMKKKLKKNYTNLNQFHIIFQNHF